MCLVQLCNDNQGFIMVLLTLVYVVATIIIVCQMSKSNRISRQLEKNRCRPYVIFDIFVKKELFIHASIKNIGFTPACNVKVNITPALTKEIEGKVVKSILADHVFKLLAPGREIDDYIASTGDKEKTLSYQGTIEYEDSESEKYSEPFEIDISYYKERRHIVDKNVGQELGNIGRTLDKIERTLKK